MKLFWFAVGVICGAILTIGFVISVIFPIVKIVQEFVDDADDFNLRGGGNNPFSRNGFDDPYIGKIS